MLSITRSTTREDNLGSVYGETRCCFPWGEMLVEEDLVRGSADIITKKRCSIE